MSSGGVPEPRIVSSMPEPREPEACFISAAWDRAEVSDSIDGVRIRLESGWTIRSHDDDNAWIVNEDDPDRFEFAIQLRRVDLRRVSPLDFLRLEVLQSDAENSHNLSRGSIEMMSPTRWQCTASGHRRTAGFSLMGAATRRWYHTRGVDSDYDIRRVLITSPDGRRGILICYTDTKAIQAGRDEAERIVESIEVEQNGRRLAGLRYGLALAASRFRDAIRALRAGRRSG